MKNYELQNSANKKSENARFMDISVYVIFLVTLSLLSPLILILISRFSTNHTEKSDTDNVHGSYVTLKPKKYNITENRLDISQLEDDCNLISASVTDNAEAILFCGQYINEKIGEVLKIFKLQPDGGIDAYHYYFANHFLESVRNKDYIYKDYSDGTIYISDSDIAYLFNTETMTVDTTYFLPKNHNVYQAVLSDDKELMALTTESGLFVGDAKMKHLKELISAVTGVNGVVTLPKNPVWSSSGDYIYYTLYADSYVKGAGRTTLSPGGNELFTALENNSFYILPDDSIFYYTATSYETGFENLFKCGYFTADDKKINDMIKSRVYYFDIRISQQGTHLAALSYNGKMKKISVIDVKTKKTIYSLLYDEIYEFSFSPNEKNLIIYGKRDYETSLSIIQIDWETE